MSAEATLWSSADLGTNTFRLLVAREVSPGVLAEHSLLQETVRLGEGIGRGGRGVAPDAWRRAEACLGRFAAHLDAVGVSRRVGVLTAVGRDLSDPSFLGFAQSVLKARLVVPTGEEEARLSFRGALSLLPPPLTREDLLVLDIGGGSTELAARAGDALDALSLPTGVVRLSESLPLDDPPTASQWTALRQSARAALVAAADRLDAPAWARRLAGEKARFIATAGTPLTVAAEAFGLPIRDTRALGGLFVTQERLEEITRRFRALTASSREALPSVVPGREVVILPGLALLGEALSLFGAPGFWVSDGGVLEGILLAEVSRLRGREAAWG